MVEEKDTPGEKTLRLYVSGMTSGRSRKAIAEAEAMLRTEALKGYALEVADLLENCASAQRDGVIATPTLLKTGPGSSRKIIGDLKDASKVLSALGLE